jgi:hypothetical protein
MLSCCKGNVDLIEERKTGNEQRVLRVSLVVGEEGFYSTEIPALWLHHAYID